VIEKDTEIWQAFRQGDKSAFERLLYRYYRPLFDYGLKFQKDPDILRDDLHDLMLSLWERRAFLNDTDNLKLYLFAALRHQIFRGKQSAKLLIEISGEFDDASVGQAAEEEMIQAESARAQSVQISHVMQKLSRRQQEVLHLKFFEELSNEQIAGLLGISRPAVANLLYSALRAFKLCWKTEFTLVFLMIIMSR